MGGLSVGVIGLGNMGRELARNLLEAGFEVSGYDVDDRALEDAASHGVSASASIRALVSASEVVLSSLPTPAVVEQVYLGEDGALEAADAGQVFLETSTIDPDTTREVAAAAADRGVAVLDTPVSGGVGRARDGNLTIMVGGDRAVYEEERIQAVLGALGTDQHYAGDVGSGHTLKLLNNLIATGTTAVVMEVAALAAELDVDWGTYMDVVATSSGSSYTFRKGMPRVLNRDFDATFTLALGHKDSGLALDVAAGVDRPMPMSGLAHELGTEAIAKGFGDESTNAVVKVFEDSASRLVESGEPVDPDRLAWREKG